MKLYLEDIKSITQGAESIKEKDGNIMFCRFNDAERKLYLDTKLTFYNKVFATSGIQMEFNTDGDFLNLKIAVSNASSRTYFSLDVFVNEALVGSCKNFEDSIKDTDYTVSQFVLGEFEKRFSLGKGRKKVRLVFPWSVAAEIKHIEIENSTYIEPVKKSKSMLAYGDSITHGYDALFSSASYAVRLAHDLDAEIFNKGIGGEIFFPQLAAIKHNPAPDYITVAYGTNDWNVSEQSEFKERCKQFFSLISANYPDTLIFAITPIWRKNFAEKRQFGDFHDVDKIIHNICAEYINIKVISGWQLVPHDERYFADLCLHPNDDGFDYYFENLKTEILKHL